MLYLIFLCLCLFVPHAHSLEVGLGISEITPPIGTPSAGYRERKGAAMEGIYDPLLAEALILDNEDSLLIFCTVDHLGFPFELVQKISEKVHLIPGLEKANIYLSSSHTHSGAGAYLTIPLIGEVLAGPYDPKIENFLIARTVEAVEKASKNRTKAKIGFGYGVAEGLSEYRSSWPQAVDPLCEVAVIKLTTLEGIPLCCLFNFATHPTVLTSKNRLFSSDFVGFARSGIQNSLGYSVQAMFLNGAQGDLKPKIFNDHDRYDACKLLGESLAKKVSEIWECTNTSENVVIQTKKHSFTFGPKATPFDLLLPLKSYESEINAIIFDQTHAFITIPGELSTLYDQKLKGFGSERGFSHVSILGLTNDAHGYIITPEAWRHKTAESGLSFGGEHYGDQIFEKASSLLEDEILSPTSALNP